MLDEKDIQNLIAAQKEVFVTKQEFESFMEIVATKEELAATKEEMKQGFDKVGKDIAEIKSLLIDFGGKAVKLENRVDYIENVLAIKK